MAQFFVELYHDFLCHAGDGRNVTYTGADDGRSVILNVGNLDYCKVKITEKSVAQFLSRFREMEVEVVGVVRVDALAQVRMVLIGGTLADCVGAGEYAVAVVAG